MSFLPEIEPRTPRSPGPDRTPAKAPKLKSIPESQALQILEDIGLNPMQASFFLEVLDQDNLVLLDLVNWGAEEQKDKLVEVLPSMGNAKIDGILKKLRLTFFDMQEKAAEDLRARTSSTRPKGIYVPTPPRTPDQRQETPQKQMVTRPASSTSETEYPQFPRGNSDIAMAIENCTSSSDTWTQIGKDAGDLLNFEREEEQKAYHKVQERMAANIIKCQKSLQGPILVMGPSKLVPPGLIYRNGGGPPPEALAPAPPKKEKRSPRARRSKGGMEIEGAPGEGPGPFAKHDWKKMLSTQKSELQFADRTHKSYLLMLDNLLQDQALIGKDHMDNPWDLTLGPYHSDPKERMLKRELLHHFKAAPSPTPIVESSIDQVINQQIEELVASVDQNGDGQLSFDELGDAVKDDPEMAVKLQTVKINLALSSANKLQHTDNKLKKAILQMQLSGLRSALDTDGSGYLELDELVAAAENNPELTKKLSRIGIHLNRMIK